MHGGDARWAACGRGLALFFTVTAPRSKTPGQRLKRYGGVLIPFACYGRPVGVCARTMLNHPHILKQPPSAYRRARDDLVHLGQQIYLCARRTHPRTLSGIPFAEGRSNNYAYKQSTTFSDMLPGTGSNLRQTLFYGSLSARHPCGRIGRRSSSIARYRTGKNLFWSGKCAGKARCKTLAASIT
jgi:hypothetical protein